VRTWAPRGETPILRVPFTHDHLSAISAITLDGRFFLQMREDSYNGEAVVGFLRVLLRSIPGMLLLIWDGSPIHHGQAVKDFLREGASAAGCSGRRGRRRREAAGRDHPLYAHIAGLMSTLLSSIESLGIATASEVDIETLEQRLADEVVAVGATIVWVSLIGAAARAAEQ
jgi:hypothetical protein